VIGDVLVGYAAVGDAIGAGDVATGTCEGLGELQAGVNPVANTSNINIGLFMLTPPVEE
jgi:hypothetical protein